MSGAVFGGDEVGAVVLDMGSDTIKAGHAGEDLPRAVFPSLVGCRPGTVMDIDRSDDGLKRKPGEEFVMGTQSINRPVAGMELKPLLKDGMVEDWELFEFMINYTFSDALRLDPTEHPMMISDVMWNTAENRKKTAEILFEKFNIPALYLCKSPVLSAFASGRSSALVIDAGAEFTSAAAVYDGLALMNTNKRSRLAGNLVTLQQRHLLREKIGADITPPYMLDAKVEQIPGQAGQNMEFSKIIPEKGIKPVFSLKKNLPEVHSSYHEYMCKQVVQDFHKNVSRASQTPYTDALANIPNTQYEFPDGYNQDFGVERYTVTESLFNPTFVKQAPGVPDQAELIGVANLVRSVIDSADIDVRQILWQNIVMTGSSSLTDGYLKRFDYELQQVLPMGTKYKVIASNVGPERKFSSWIGGSILSSMGSFQQNWFSRAEYDDSGADTIDQKCP